LWHPNENVFYILDTSFQKLKFIQILLAKYYDLPVANVDVFFNLFKKLKNTATLHSTHLSTREHEGYLKSIKSTSLNKNYQQELNNNNCFLFGLHDTTLRQLDVSITNTKKPNQIVKHDENNTAHNKELREKIFLLRYILCYIDASIDYYSTLGQAQHQLNQQSTLEFGNFFKLCYPLDTKIQQIVQDETEWHNDFKSEIFTYKSVLMQLLIQLDYSRPNAEVLSQLIALLKIKFFDIFQSVSNVSRSNHINLLKHAFSQQLTTLLQHHE